MKKVAGVPNQPLQKYIPNEKTNSTCTNIRPDTAFIATFKILNNPSMKALLFSSLIFIKLQFFPSTDLLFWMFIAIVIDFITGVTKAVIQGEARTSNGFRKTITKFLQYGVAIAVSVIMANTAKQNNMDSASHLLFIFNDGLLVFIIYIEVTSIFENLYACDQNTVFSKYFISPVLKILTAQIKNNPIFKEGEKVNQNQSNS